MLNDTSSIVFYFAPHIQMCHTLLVLGLCEIEYLWLDESMLPLADVKSIVTLDIEVPNTEESFDYALVGTLVTDNDETGFRSYHTCKPVAYCALARQPI